MKKQLSTEELAAWKAEREQTLSGYRAAKQFAEANKDNLMKQIAAAEIGFGKPISLWSFAFVLQQMQEQGLEGVPYLHARTYQEWKRAGRQVRRGETAKLISVTWIGEEDKNVNASETDKQNAKHYPKLTRLFHHSQTAEVKEENEKEGEDAKD